MGQFVCHKCGLKAYSKNPATRNVFPAISDLASTAVRGIMSFNVEPDKYREGREDLVLRMSMWAPNSDTKEKAIEHLFELFKEIELEDLKKATCAHDWEPVNGPEDYEV